MFTFPKVLITVVL